MSECDGDCNKILLEIRDILIQEFGEKCECGMWGLKPKAGPDRTGGKFKSGTKCRYCLTVRFDEED